MDKYICIHGHFYQPPRENPWLEEIEFQDSAYPYHDWNERITAECYAPNAASRILDDESRIIEITNTYAKISFDFGPTLLSWMERHKPDVYEAILDADKLSIKSFAGHGSAMAQAYNHIILPLANKNDKHTQVLWGIKDFRKRFQRHPEGMWLPETAVDMETLEVLVDHGIKFTVLSPKQAKRTRKTGDGEWNDVSEEKVDPTMAYISMLPSGRSISLFFYDGPISREISFEGLLKNGEVFAERLLSVSNAERSHAQIIHTATDGETFGHHHRFGEMALSYCLHYIESNNLAKITNYGEYLEKYPPTHEVEIFENSSWSCVHGVERWRSDCGCNSGKMSGWDQGWRKPLREAMDWLRDKTILIYESEASRYFKGPWEVRNEYIEVILDRSHDNVETFLEKHAIRKLSKDEKINALKLLELQRNAMLMYTSCGWFFDDISGIETIQIMQYALRTIQYIEELVGSSINSEYLKFLEKTPCNKYKNALEVYDMFVKPARSDLLRVGTHYCISSIFEDYPETTKIFCYTAKGEKYNKIEAGKLRLVTGKAKIISDITWEEKTICFAVLYPGNHNISGGAKDFTDEDDFLVMQSEMKGAFENGLPETKRLMDKHFSSNIYSIGHLFKDEQKKILDLLLKLTYDEIGTSYRQIYENNYAIMNVFDGLHIRLPRPFFVAAEYILFVDIKKVFKEEALDVDKLRKLIEEAKKWDIKIDTTTLRYVATSWLNSTMDSLQQQPENIQLFETIDNALEVLRPLSLSLDFWKAQNSYFSIGKNFYNTMKEKAANGDSFAKSWVESFMKLGNYLNVKIRNLYLFHQGDNN